MTEEQISVIQSEVRLWKPHEVKKNRELNKKLEQYHLQIFGKPADCINCINKIDKAIWKIVNLKSQQYPYMGKYRIKEVNGKPQMITNNHVVPGVPIHVTNANLTDEIAELLLHSNFARFIEEVNGQDQPPKEKIILRSAPRTMVQPPPLNPTLQELLDSKNRAEIIKALQEKGIVFDPKANKKDLAELLLK